MKDSAKSSLSALLSTPAPPEHHRTTVLNVGGMKFVEELGGKRFLVEGGVFNPVTGTCGVCGFGCLYPLSLLTIPGGLDLVVGLISNGLSVQANMCDGTTQQGWQCYCDYLSSDTSVATINPSCTHYVTGVNPGNRFTNGTAVDVPGPHCGEQTLFTRCNIRVLIPELVGVFTSLVSGDANATISGQAFTLQIQARVPGSSPPRVATSFNNPVSVSFGTLVSGESISQTSVPMSHGVGQTQVVIKVIDSGSTPSCCRTYALAANGATSTTGQVNVWFPVTMDIERWKNCNFPGCPNLGSYFCTSSCVTQGFSSPFPFVSLTSNVCGATSVIIRNSKNNATQATTVLDVGPSTNRPYWNDGNIPSLGGCISDSLADQLVVSYGCNPNIGQASVLWRFQ